MKEQVKAKKVNCFQFKIIVVIIITITNIKYTEETALQANDISAVS